MSALKNGPPMTTKQVTGLVTQFTGLPTITVKATATMVKVTAKDEIVFVAMKADTADRWATRSVENFIVS